MPAFRQVAPVPSILVIDVASLADPFAWSHRPPRLIVPLMGLAGLVMSSFQDSWPSACHGDHLRK
jgi:hypothetical protein